MFFDGEGFVYSDEIDPKCKHEWVNVSFFEWPGKEKWVCKHCDIEKGEG
jgi:hypothetical protein